MSCQRKASDHDHAGGDQDPIPEALMAVLLNLGGSAGSDIKEPPAKRQKQRKLSQPRQTYCLTRLALEIVRPFGKTGSSGFDNIHCPDISGRLDIVLDRYNLNMLGMDRTNSGIRRWALLLAPTSTRKQNNRRWHTLPLDPDMGVEDSIRNLLNMPRDLAAKREEAFIRVQTGFSMRAKSSNTAVLTFLFRLLWDESVAPHEWRQTRPERHLSSPALKLFSPYSFHDYDWSPKHFYDSVFVPPKDDPDSASISIPELTTITLYPFQKRTLQWLLNREGARWLRGKGVVDARIPSLCDNLFQPVTDAEGNPFFLSNLLHAATSDPSIFAGLENSNVRGGILADEMGLGKTLTSISLIILNPRRDGPALHPDVPQGLCPSGATLIVTPEQLRGQWQDELARHAPHLRVKVYAGCKNVKTDAHERSAVEELARHDVVLTTYAVLSSELDFAIDPPNRSSRTQRVYHRTKSPLVQIHWWRVCLDEAQMVESKVSRTATLARIIPRVNSWGITGTPVKSSVDDLLGLLVFLGAEPYCSNSMVWKELISFNKALFKTLVSNLAVRHTKGTVRDELQLPSQRRYVISLPFTAVEQHHYQSLLVEMAADCDLSASGRPLQDDWRLEKYESNMKSWLNRLRQAALHPEIGISNRRALGTSKSVRLRTVDEVLEAMIQQSRSAIRTEQRAYMNARLFHGQILEKNQQIREALVIWEAVREEAGAMVDECRSELSDVAKDFRHKGLDKSVSDDSSSSDDGSGDEGMNGPRGRVAEYRRRLRNTLESSHCAVFFCANAYFQIRESKDMTAPDSAEFEALKRLEDERYEGAKKIRREILQEPQRRAKAVIEQIAERASKHSFVSIPEMAPLGRAGIESQDIVSRAEELFNVLNAQAGQLDKWREAAVKLVLKPLVDEDEDPEATGDEYSDSARTQDELIVLVWMIRALVGDRHDAISGLTNELVKHEAEVKERSALEGDGPAPETFLRLLRVRNRVKPVTGVNGSMRGIIGELRALQTRLKAVVKGGEPRNERQRRSAAELVLVSGMLQKAQTQTASQTKTATALDSEIELFTSAMNVRVKYYRQLQALSDGVAPLDGTYGKKELDECVALEAQQSDKLNTSQSKHRYLTNLKESGAKAGETCIICRSDFNLGVLTICGHSFCKICILQWFKNHRSCPVCKRPLKSTNLHDIVIRPQQVRVHTAEGRPARSQDAQPSRGSEVTGIYSLFTDKKLAEIKNIELDGPPLTTKVDMLVRHLLWLRETDPGAKSIVFSQYTEFLNVLRNAFARFRISFSSIDQLGGIARFKADAGVEVFLLHARAHSSGLNLTNASHVFLCEPLLNTALELQAIARVDRIGQQHDTTVWLYLVSGTVEESIYNLSVRRRMDHAQDVKEHGHGDRRGRNKKCDDTGPAAEGDASGGQELMLEEANTLELEHAQLDKLMNRDRSLGEAVQARDLWECLFGADFFTDENRKEKELERTENRAVMQYLAEQAEGRHW